MGCLFSMRRRSQNGKGKLENEKVLIIENEKVNVFEIKRRLKQMKEYIRAIRISKCISNRERFESLDILLLREDLQVGDFPMLQSVVINFEKIETKDTSNASLDDKLYEKALQTIEKDVKIHTLLKQNVSKERLSINQLTFRDKRAFLYTMRKMTSYISTLRVIELINIVTVKKNIFQTLFQSMREIINLSEIHIINTNITIIQAFQIQQLLCWKQKDIKVLNISGANLIDTHIDILFFQKLYLSDLKNLQILQIVNCNQLWKSSKYIKLMKQYTAIKKKQLKSEQKDSNQKLQQKSKLSIQEDKKEEEQIQIKLKELDHIQEEKDKADNGEDIPNLNLNIIASPAFPMIDLINHENKGGSSNLALVTQQHSSISPFKNIATRPLISETSQTSQQSRGKSNLQILRAKQGRIGNAQKLFSAPSQYSAFSNNNSKLLKFQSPTPPTFSFLEKDKDYLHSNEKDDQDENYDNRHSRCLLIGQSLFDQDRQSKLEKCKYNDNLNYNELLKNDQIQEIQDDQNSEKKSDNSDESKIEEAGGAGFGNSGDNQFFSQFLKSCLRDLNDIDMCLIIDFSQFCYQNMTADYKKQISNYIVNSNCLQILVIQYDRVLFKDLCEQISVKYRQTVQDAIKLNKKYNPLNLQQDQATLIGYLNQNLLSLEQINIIASEYESFQFDSFCFISYLTLFLLSISIDFQHQQVEDSILFPSHQQVIQYLTRMIRINDEEEEEEEFDNEEDQGDEQSSNQLDIQKETGGDLKQKENEKQKPSTQGKKNKYNRHVGEGNEYYEIYDNIRQFMVQNDVQTIACDLVLCNFKWNNIQNDNKDKSFKQFLFTYLSLSSKSIMNIELQQVKLSHSCLMKLQELIKKVYFLQYQELRGEAYKESLKKNKASNNNNNNIAFTLNDSENDVPNDKQKQKQLEDQSSKSILQINNQSIKKKYFLNKFKIVFQQPKMMPIQLILTVFGTMCKEVEIINALNQDSLIPQISMSVQQGNASSKKKNENQAIKGGMLGEMVLDDEEVESFNGENNQSHISNKKIALRNISFIDYLGFNHLNMIQIVDGLNYLEELSLVRCNLSIIQFCLILQILTNKKNVNLKKLVVSGNDFSSLILKQSQIDKQIKLINAQASSQSNIPSDIAASISVAQGFQIKKQSVFSKKVSQIAEAQRYLKSMVDLAKQQQKQQQFRFIKNKEDDLAKLLESMRQSGGQAGFSEIINYCLRRILSLRNLTHLDLSSNQLTDQQGKQILDFFRIKSSLILRYKIQSQHRQQKKQQKENESQLKTQVDNQAQEQGEIPKSGFYNKFLEKQLSSNVRNTHQYGASQNKKKITSFSTKFFTDDPASIKQQEEEDPNKLNLQTYSDSDSESEPKNKQQKEEEEQIELQQYKEEQNQEEQKEKIQDVLKLFHKNPIKKNPFGKLGQLVTQQQSSSSSQPPQLKQLIEQSKNRKIKKQEILICEIVELHLEYNNFSSEVISDICKQIPILFNKIKVLNLSQQVSSSMLSRHHKQVNDIINLAHNQQEDIFSFESEMNEDPIVIERKQLNVEFDKLVSESKSNLYMKFLNKLIISNINFKSTNLFELKSYEQLMELDISNCVNSSRSALSFITQLQQLQQQGVLRKFIMNRSIINKSNMKNIIYYLLVKFVRLESISISNSQLNQQSINSILDGFKELSMVVALQELNISSNPDIKPSLKSFIFNLSKIQQVRLQTLDLSNCQLNDENCEQMIQGLIQGKKWRQKQIIEQVMRTNEYYQKLQFTIDIDKDQQNNIDIMINNIKNIQDLSLIRLILYDNKSISVRMHFLIQYSFVFQVTEQENILFTMQFTSDEDNKQKLAQILSNLKSNKEQIYYHLFNKHSEQLCVQTNTLSLGNNILSSTKQASDVLISSLRTFHSINNFQIFVNDKVAQTFNQILNYFQQNKIPHQEDTSIIHNQQIDVSINPKKQQLQLESSACKDVLIDKQSLSECNDDDDNQIEEEQKQFEGTILQQALQHQFSIVRNRNSHSIEKYHIPTNKLNKDNYLQSKINQGFSPVLSCHSIEAPPSLSLSTKQKEKVVKQEQSQLLMNKQLQSQQFQSQLQSQQIYGQNALGKQENYLIHLRRVDNLCLLSDNNIGVSNILQLFSLISYNLETLDLTKLSLSYSTFILLTQQIQLYFKNIKSLKFANVKIEQIQSIITQDQIKNPDLQAIKETSQAILPLMTSKSLQYLTFINCSISQEIFLSIAQQLRNSNSQVTTKYLNLSKNSKISFKDESAMHLLDKLSVLNLSECGLNDNKFNINPQSWTQQHLQSLIELNLSYNKGLSVMFFSYLGQYVSSNKTLLFLDISYTAMYEDKQNKFTQGLNKNKLTNVALQVFLIKGITFTKQQGTLTLLQAVAQFKSLKLLDLTDIHIYHFKQLDLLHHYFRYCKLNQITILSLQNCQFLFEQLPFDINNFAQAYSFTNYNHSSLYILSQFQSLQELDLSGCLQTKRLSSKFLNEIQIMRKNRLFNYSITKLNIAKNQISAAQIKSLIFNVLYIFKNLQTLNMRSSLRFEQDYVINLLDGLNCFQQFAVQQDTHQLKNIINNNQQQNSHSNINNLIHTLQQYQQVLDGQVAVIPNNSNEHENNEIINNNNNDDQQKLLSPQKNAFSNEEEFENMDMQYENKTGEYIDVQLQILEFSDVSSDLVNHKEAIDSLLQTCIINRNYSNLKQIIIYQDYQQTGSVIRLQSSYTESLLDLNEQLDLEKNNEEYCQYMNYKVKFAFHFKDTPTYINLKPMIQKINKSYNITSNYNNFMNSNANLNNENHNHKTINNTNTKIMPNLATEDKYIKKNSNNSNNYKSNKSISFVFIGMRIEYVDSSLEDHHQYDVLKKYQQSQPQSQQEVKSDTHLLINEWNESILNSNGSSESDEYQIEIWRKFEDFTKRLHNYREDKRTHISLNYINNNIKLLSQEYNIFIDHKYNFNDNLSPLLTNIQSLYLGNILYHFLVSLCAFNPKKDLIDFLIKYLIFVSTSSQPDLANKSIRVQNILLFFSLLTSLFFQLPPFLILSEVDAGKIQEAFMSMQDNSKKEKKQSFHKDELIEIEQLHSQDPGFNSMRTKRNMIDKKFQKQQSDVNKNQDRKIVCNYYYRSNQNCQEFLEVGKLQKMPPSTLDIDNFSVNGLKAVYMICYNNDYFIKGEIDYESIMFVSTSAAFSLREYFYKEYQSSSRFGLKSLIQKIFYILLDIFVDVDEYFKYDESIQALDKYVQQQTNIIKISKLLVCYYLLALYVFFPIFSLLSIGPQDIDKNSYISHGIYISYGIISFFFEIFLLNKSIKLTRHLIPDIPLTHQDSLIPRIVDYLKERFMNIEMFSYKNVIFFMKTLFSLMSKLEKYQDMTFLLICVHQGETLISILSIVVIVLNKVLEFIILQKTLSKDSYSNLFFSNLNSLYEYSLQLQFEGLSQLFDTINPHNVLKIDNNFITRRILPKKALGMTINKKIFNKVSKVLYCNIPQIIIQLLYAFRKLAVSSSSIKLAIALNLVSIVKSFLLILTIKQSILNQMDFDELSEQKSAYLNQQFLQYQEKETQMFEQINQNVSEILTTNNNKNNDIQSQDQQLIKRKSSSHQNEDDDEKYQLHQEEDVPPVLAFEFSDNKNNN